MKLIVFAVENDPAADGFLKHMKSYGAGLSCQRFTTIPNMVGALREPIAERMIFVLFINKNEELRQVDSHKGLFRSNPILILLADTNEDALNLGHLIGARYIGDQQTEAGTLALIVSRISLMLRQPQELDEKSQAEEAINRC